MKKEYTTPEVEKVEFNYCEQVVASSGNGCIGLWNKEGPYGCVGKQEFVEYLK